QCAGGAASAGKLAQHNFRSRYSQSDGALWQRSGDRSVSRAQNLRWEKGREQTREHHGVRTEPELAAREGDLCANRDARGRFGEQANSHAPLSGTLSGTRSQGSYQSAKDTRRNQYGGRDAADQSRRTLREREKTAKSVCVVDRTIAGTIEKRRQTRAQR